MPQLDLTSFASQIFWLCVTFSFLYYILAVYSLPRVREVLQSRQDRIRGDLDRADLLKKEAERVETEYNTALQKARQKASEHLEKIRAVVKEEAEARHAKLDEMFARQNKETEQRISVLRKEATQELSIISEEVAAQITKKLIGLDITKDQAQKARKAS
jgi:F-type H+-transporting ATPase subunit b